MLTIPGLVSLLSDPRFVLGRTRAFCVIIYWDQEVNLRTADNLIVVLEIRFSKTQKIVFRIIIETDYQAFYSPEAFGNKQKTIAHKVPCSKFKLITI